MSGRAPKYCRRSNTRLVDNARHFSDTGPGREVRRLQPTLQRHERPVLEQNAHQVSWQPRRPSER